LGKRFAYVAKAVPPVEPPGPEPPPEPPGGGGGGYTDTAYVARCYHTSSYTISVETDDPVIVVAGTPSNYEVSGSSTSHSINVSSGYNGVWLCVTSGSISIESLAITDSHVREVANLDDLDDLETLDLSDNGEMTSLDASDCTSLSAFPRLTNSDSESLTVDLSGCTALTSISLLRPTFRTLDVSGCTSLTYLGIAIADLLTALNASGCTEMTECLLLNTALQTVDVSGGTSLADLRISNADLLSTLDISECMALEDVDIFGGSLSSFDISNRAALTNLELKNLYSMTSLNMSGCTALTGIDTQDLEALETVNASGCTSLETLTLSLNEAPALVSLDVTNCIALTSLSTTWVETVTSVTVAGCTALETIDLFRSHSLPSIDLSDQEDSLTTLTISARSMESLDLTGFGLLEDASIAIGSSTALTLTNCIALASLTLNGASASWTAQALASLTDLRIDGTWTALNLSALNSNAMELRLIDNLALTSINLDGYDITLLSLSANTSLSSISIANCTSLLDVQVTNPNNLDNSDRGGILVDLDNAGQSNGDADVGGAVDAAGQAAKTSLEGKGWTVST